HVGRTGGEGHGDVARVADAAVGPHVLAVPARLGGALQHGGELRPADAGHHAGGAHGAGADTDLDDVRARLDQVAHTGRGDDVARGDRHLRVEVAHQLQRVDHRLLVAVRGVDDEGVHARVQQLLGLPGDVAVDADGGGDPQPPPGVGGRRVQRGAQGALAGQDACQAAAGVDGRGVAPVGAVEGVEGLTRVHGGVDEQQVPGHDLGELGEAVHAGQVVVGDHADRPPVVVDHDARVVRPL